jgi:hypothetical protein
MQNINESQYITVLKNLHKSFRNTKISSLIDNSLLSLEQEKLAYHKEDSQKNIISLNTV